MNFIKLKRGFTLIELLVVVAIIGVLASIILVGLSGFRSRGRDARRIADLRQVQNGLELFFTRTGAYPTASCWSGGATCLSEVLVAAGIGINQIPRDPTPTQNYGYCASSGRYTMSAVLEGSNQALNDQVGVTYPCVASVACFNSGVPPATGGVYCVTI